MGALSNLFSGLDGLTSGNLSTDGGALANASQLMQGVAGVAGGIATAGGAKNTPQSVVPTSSVPAPLVGPTGAATPGQAIPVGHTVTPGSGVSSSGTASTTTGAPSPNAPTTGTGASPVPTSNPTQTVNGVPVSSINGGDLNSVYGVDTGTALTNLFDQEGTGANSTAQAIINANAPNVAQGAATLNEGLAQSGISPSSSVSAIENANYQSGVQQQNLSTEAEVGLTEQQMQQQLLESLLPSQQQRQTDSSGWSIFGDVASGIGDIFGL